MQLKAKFAFLSDIIARIMDDCRVSKKEEIDNFDSSHGMSTNAFINISIDEKTERDGQMININMLRAMNRPEQIAITEHARVRLIERKITVNDIVNCIAKGEIIEQYEQDKPLASCLVLGLSVNNKYMHIIVSHDKDYIYLITAYYPDRSRWESNLKTRKGR